ncbi:MAG: endopeptidase La [Anaerolineae bacterium]|nr:endopeptidase La [Anaerolineae bacterium]
MFDSLDTSQANDRLEQLIEQIPDELPILPLRNTVAFPFAVIPLAVGVPRSIKLIEAAIEGNRLIGMVASTDPEIEAPTSAQIHDTGTVGLVHRVVRAPNDSLSVVVQGLERFKVEEWTQEEPFITARIRLTPDHFEDNAETEALRRGLVQVAKEVVELMPGSPQGVADFFDQVEHPRYLVYLVAANSRLDMAEAQKLIEIDTVNEKMRALITHLNREKEVLEIGQKISEEAQEEMSKAQREYYLRQQLEAIRRELGEADESNEADDYRRKIEEAQMPEDARKEAERELDRLAKLPPQAAEYSVIKTYLDWLVTLPWSRLSEDNLDIEHARAVLDEDHYDLQEIKDRILEHLAVRKLARERDAELVESEDEARREDVQKELQESAGAILCFVGPPGVGKTSLGQSIARALGRKFTRMSLGGMRDEAEIRGHRRTYIGAMPGRIIQAIKRTGTRNPVFMLDEVDKIGADWRGDPASALLEVLDPQQNRAFRDHYLDVDFDLSDVIFITTANQLETVPAPLRDRMEILRLDGYTEHEKVRIAQGYLVPRQRRANRLHEDEISFADDALRAIIRDYTREAGVRSLEREIGTVCRKEAVKIAAGKTNGHVEVSPELARAHLGKPKVFSEAALRTAVPGVATGLAWTPTGGDVLFVEATRMKGKGGLTITGQLGKVMEESVRIAYSYARAKARALAIDEALFETSDFHVHVPEGAIPKDGPSAGVTMVSALASLLTARPVRADLGMTGEITLRGQVLPIGGVKHKVLAAHRAGLKTVVLPKRNAVDLDELPDEVREEMSFILVERIDEVLDAALCLECVDDDTVPAKIVANGNGTEPEAEPIAASE